jgi:hypothetical protein
MKAAVCIIVICAAASFAHADINYLTDTRTLHAAATAGNPSTGNSPQDNGAAGPIFNTSVTATMTYTGVPTGHTTSTASQHSELLANSISGTGGGHVSISFGGDSLGAYFGSSDSDVNVTFHLDSPVSFSLTATASDVGFPPPSPSAILFQLSGGSLGSPFLINPGGAGINASGVLDAGDYHIEAHAHSFGANGGQNDSNFNFLLTVPAPASIAPGLAALGLFMRRRR